LVVAWLYFDPGLNFENADGVSGEIVDLAKTVGPVGTALGVSVAAYLLGSLSTGLTARVFNLVQNIWVIAVGWLRMTKERRNRLKERRIRRGWGDASSLSQGPRAAPAETSPTRSALTNLSLLIMPSVLRTSAIERRDRIAVEKALRQLSELWDEANVPRPVEEDERARNHARHVRRRLEGEVRSLLPRVLPDRYGNLADTRQHLARVFLDLTVEEFVEISNAIRTLRLEMKWELKLPVTILVANNPTLYAEADRLRAEAEFRSAAVPPFVALVVLLAADTTPWAWALLIVAYVLLGQASSYARSSEFLVAEARKRGNAPSPTLERFRRIVAAIVAAHEPVVDGEERVEAHADAERTMAPQTQS
jgi:hypothetical protein